MALNGNVVTNYQNVGCNCTKQFRST